ncbi:hypothetical protein CSUI_000552 [Cystoisospora suis]|uniref:Uncharacterized protein n=1 Tax=Cystoisospora suis TaxID=483139 RepID=A0A2C6LFR3_9APIC|nr:hypothetical protein CSUI_000552 [Cystoisospora suis]
MPNRASCEAKLSLSEGRAAGSNVNCKLCRREPAGSEVRGRCPRACGTEAQQGIPVVLKEFLFGSVTALLCRTVAFFVGRRLEGSRFESNQTEPNRRPLIASTDLYSACPCFPSSGGSRPVRKRKAGRRRRGLAVITDYIVAEISRS